MRPNVICTKINSCQSARTCPSVAQEHLECGIFILVAYTGIIIAVMNSISITAGRIITFVISMPSIQWLASELVSE